MSYLQAAAPTVDMLAQMSRCLLETAQGKVIQGRQIHLPPSSSQCLGLTEVPYPPFLDLQRLQLARFLHRYINSCSLRCFTGADAARRKQSKQARGLITLI